MEEKRVSKYLIEEAITSLPIYQYAMIAPGDIVFDEQLRSYCKRQCPHFKTCWSCPPAVGSVESCSARCRSYVGALLFSTMREDARRDEIPEDLNKEPHLSYHERITCRAEKLFEDMGLQTYTLTGDVCRACRRCGWPKNPCSYPEIMHPCIEGHGIRVPVLATQCGMDTYLTDGSELLFSLIFYKEMNRMILH